MTTKITVPLSEVDEQFLKELKEKHPSHARLYIQVVDMDSAPAFKEEHFWSIIDMLDWNAKTRGEVLKPAVAALAQRPNSDIYLFEDYLAEKLFLLDTRAHAEAAYPNSRISEDGFLYVRAAVIARGQAFFLSVLESPSQIDPEEDFEPLLSLSSLAYETKNGNAFDYTAPVSYETYANEKGGQ
ncbi:DUF4240 domain-containing protein [Phaeodactylibacter xiamenensis]|mgnify:FL=1|uniref:DUF4240 domain-containing protein n=1 Tax=Phaeodactylibacter xiamenensis TaxID=1524460 RepID=UPI0024A90904|nr:DUF4240 domain-containing protein [Phaeodactylibacter xiamenensis]